MSYTKTNWIDNVTPASAVNMNRIEESIEALDEVITNWNVEAGLDSINMINEQLADVTNTVVYVESFKIQTGETTDSPRIQRAIDSLTNGGTVIFAPKTYNIDTTITLPSYIKLQGSGRRSTILNRTSNVVILKAQGISILSGGPQIKEINVSSMMFKDNNNGSADIVQLIACAYVYFYDCYFYGTLGRHILAWELFDSRFVNCDFEWGGTADGTVPGIELKSDSGYEYTNNVYFIGCRNESYRGTALATTGANTNKIHMFGCKFESQESVVTHVDMSNSASTQFYGVVIAGSGTNNFSATPAQMLNLTGVYNFKGDIMFELNGTIPGTNCAYWGTFATVANTNACDLNVSILNGASLITGTSIVTSDNVNSDIIRISGVIKGGEPTGKTLTTQSMPSKSVSIVTNGESSVQFTNKSVSSSDSWFLGRIIAQGGGTQCRVIHNISGTETTAMYFDNNSNVNINTNLNPKQGFYLASLATPPWQAEGLEYIDTSNAIACLRRYNNGALHRTGYASAAPTSGTWATGDIIYNTAPTSGGYVGWVCTAGGTSGTWKTFGLIS